MTNLLADVKSASVVIGGLVFIVSLAIWAFRKTPDQKNQEIDQSVQKQKESAEESGRPV